MLRHYRFALLTSTRSIYAILEVWTTKMTHRTMLIAAGFIQVSIMMAQRM